MLSACLGAIILVCVIPVFWRGQPAQAPIAFLFAVVPILALFNAAVVAAKYL